MKKHLLFFVLIGFTFLKAQITYPIPALEKGPYLVATADLEHDETKISTVVSVGGNVGEYWEGRYDGKKYVSQLLKDNTGAIQFEITVPNDPTLYGEEAGNTLTYTALLFYPTNDNNTRSDYTLPGGSILQRMQKGDEAPIFLDPSAKYPLMIYSHGNGDQPINQKTELEYFASFGVISVALFHSDGRIKSFEASDLTQAQEFALRPLAISKLIDYLELHQHYKDNIDFDKIAVFGTSYGGATSIALLGGKIIGAPPTYAERVTTIDERIKCAVTLVPYMGSQVSPFFGMDNNGVKEVSRPLLAIAASEDEQTPFDYLKSGIQKMQGDKFVVRFNGLGHNLGEGAGEDYLNWALLFFSKYIIQDSAATDAFDKGTNIAEGADDEYIPIKVPVEPLLTSPENGFSVEGTDLQLNWEYSNNCQKYHFQIATDSLFTDIIISDNEFYNMLFNLTDIADNSKYYWRVKGINAEGEGEFSEVRYFTKGDYTNIEDRFDIIPQAYKLFQNYPNPFNPATKIIYQLPVAGEVKLNVYDSIGRLVSTLVNNHREAGTYTLNFDGNDLSSGIYIYRIEVNGFVESNKMLLIK